MAKGGSTTRAAKKCRTTVPAARGKLRARPAKQASADALLRSHKELLALFAASPLAIHAMNVDGIVTHWNPTAERMFGWSAREAIGRPLPFVPSEKRDEFLALLRRMLRGEVCKNVEVSRRRKDGGSIELSVSGAPVRDAQGRIVGIVSLNADITERRQAETRMSAQLAELRRWQDVMLDHEDRIQELKREANELCRRLGEPARYPSQEAVPRPENAKS